MIYTYILYTFLVWCVGHIILLHFENKILKEIIKTYKEYKLFLKDV